MENQCFILDNVKVKGILRLNQLVIHHEAITCVVGPSGSGKTTLLRLLNKMISPSSGTITYYNENLDSIDSITHRQEVVLLSQSPIMLEETIEDNLTVGTKYSNKELPDKEALQAMMNKLQLHKQLTDDAGSCSLGEKQRIALGRVLLMNPKVYLMDEPSASLDGDSESIIMDLIVNHTRENKQTLIMVTHNQQVADAYADYVIRLEDGEIQ